MRAQRHATIAILIVVLVLGITQLVALGANMIKPATDVTPATVRVSPWLSVAVSDTQLLTGDTVKFTFKITNRSGAGISGIFPDNADRNFTYDQDQCWALEDSLGAALFPKDVTGRFRVMAGYNGWDASYASLPAPSIPKQDCGVTNTLNHPWRWSIGNNLAPNFSRTVTGYVRFTTPGTYNVYFGIVSDQIGYPTSGSTSCTASDDPNTHTCFLNEVAITVADPTNTPTTTRTEIAEKSRVARLDFQQPLGVTTQFINSAARNNFVCPGTQLSPASTCPEITAGGPYDSNAVTFDGSQNQRIASAGRVLFSSQSTTSFWAKPTVGSEMIVLSSGIPNRILNLGFDASGRFFCEYNNSSDRLTASIPATGAWDHYACVIDNPTRERTIYVNSFMAGTDTADTTFVGSYTTVLGSNLAQSGTYYTGELDELAVYRSEFTIDGIEWLYNHFIQDPARVSPTRTHTSTPFPTDVLQKTWMSRFLFEENAGSISFVNQDDSKNPAICVNGGSCPTAGDDGVRFSDGLNFNTSQALKLTKALNISGRQSYALHAWFNAATVGSEQVLLSMRDFTDASEPTLLVGLHSDGTPFCSYDGDEIAGSDVLNTSEWYNIICTLSSQNQAVLYINGYPVANDSFTSRPTGSMQLWIGQDGSTGTDGFDGNMDVVSVMNQFVTWNDAEILYDQFSEIGKRSPTRTITPSFTRTPSPTRTPSRTRTATRTRTGTATETPESFGPYPYPLPFTSTRTTTPTITNTRTATPTRTGTITPVAYPYP